jgi:hypothetical protein
MATTIQQSAPLVCLNRIVFGCCGWGSRDTIRSNDDNDIGGGEALGGKNNNQQTMGVIAMTATGQSRGNGKTTSTMSDPICPTHNNQP